VTTTAYFKIPFGHKEQREKRSAEPIRLFMVGLIQVNLRG